MSTTGDRVQALRQLERAGFLVAENAGAGKPKADLVAYGADEDGVLKPELVVEVKRRTEPESALRQLARVAVALGVQRAFIFDGGWWAADPTFTRVEPCEIPSPTSPAYRAEASKDFLKAALAEKLFRLRDKNRDAGAFALASPDLVEYLRRSNDQIAVIARSHKNVLTTVRVLCELGSSISSGMVAIPSELADGLVRLLSPINGSRVLDPYAGDGALLWALHDAAQKSGIRVETYAPSADHELDRVRESLAALAGLDHRTVSIDREREMDRALEEVIGAQYDGILSIAPFGQKATGAARSYEETLLRRVDQLLRPCGRAVLVVPLSFLASGASAQARRFATSRFRVVSAIELGESVLLNTAVRVGVVVLEKNAPGRTLVARLTSDWRKQLSVEGDFLSAYAAHVENRG
jgi:hypothetical protein